MGRKSREKRERREGDGPMEWTTFEAQVDARSGRPFVKMTCGLGDDPVFAIKLPPDVCTALGLRAVQAAIEAERDAGLVKFVLEEFGPKIGMDDEDSAASSKHLAGVMLDGLRRFRQQFDAAAGSMRELFDDDPSDLTDDPPS